MPIVMNYKILFASLLSVTVSTYAVAQEQGETSNLQASSIASDLDLDVITAKWKCKFCPDNADDPWYSEFNIGLGYVSNDSFKFGEYNGLNEKGVFLILDIDAIYRGEDASYLDIEADNLGLDSRRIDIEGGKQGKYKVNIILDEISRYNLDTARTPYNGTTSQTLPAGWVAGATTAAMTSLPTDLHRINFDTQRRHLRVNSSIIQNTKWSYDLSFERQTKEGNTPFAAAIGTTFADARSAVLAKPIDFTTDKFELAANYKYNDIYGSLSFISSTFRNDNTALSWDNAFSVGAGSGQIALEPDNELLQIMANGQYRGFENFLINGLVSIARLTQNEAFLPYTVNGALAPPALPQNSLDGNVEVANANASANWTISEKSKIKFSYDYQEQVNETDRATYTYVVADNSITGTPRANFPYSFRTQKLKANTSYRLANKNKITGGLEYSLFDRTFQEVNRSSETSIWAKYAKRLSTDVNYSLKLESSTRDANSYNVLAELSPPENTQLRKYNLADNEVLGVSFNVDFTASERLFMNINLDQSNVDYSNSSVGLTESDDATIGIDAQYMVSDEISVTGYIQHTTITSSENGSSVAGNPDWFAENEDTITTIGIGSDYNIIEDELSIGIELVHTDATGEISLTGASATPLPDLVSKRDSVTLSVDYNYDENTTYKVSYMFEKYKEENWNLDGVTQGTIDNVLSLGEISPNYRIGVIWLSMKYQF
jgi:MtrB/PioB family decaheme-associated outer membrane protein